MTSLEKDQRNISNSIDGSYDGNCVFLQNRGMEKHQKGSDERGQELKDGREMMAKGH